MRHDNIVYIIDDEPEMCRSLEMLLALDGAQSQSFNSAEAFIAVLPRLSPGIIISDIAMPSLTGLELLAMLPALNRTDPVIMMTGHGDIALAVTAIKRGAADFIEKPFEASRMLDAVKDSRNKILHASEQQHCLASLSPRERQVLQLIVRGMTAKQTAIELAISPRTVETYRQHLMTKTGTSSLSQLVRFGVHAGIEDQLSGEISHGSKVIERR